MTILALVGFWGTVGFIVLQASLVALFVRKLSAHSKGTLEGKEKSSERKIPDSVAIILCVRGNDPSLATCLNSLMEQGTSEQKVFIVGDSINDPGIEACQAIAKNSPAEKISFLINDEIHENCGLKCSNLIYAIGRLEKDFDFFLLVDADTVVDKGWLESMIAPFADPTVCVTTGIRWFDVQGVKAGTWVRYIWNTAAIVQMVCYRIPWGGSLAIRTSFVRDEDVLDHWSRGFCEDTMLRSLARKHGGRVEVVPEAVIESAEETTLGNCIPWISRQLLTARLHHPFWPLVLGHGMMTMLLSFGLPIACVLSLILGSYSLAGWFAAAYGILQLGNFLLLNWIESPVRNKNGKRNSFLRNPLRFLIGIPLTQLSYVSAMCKTIWIHRVEWRQIKYKIRGKRISMDGYQPYKQSTQCESL